MTGRVELNGARILVLVYGHVADTMAAIPGLRSLRKAYPSARIDALVVSASQPILRDCPYVDDAMSWGDFQLKGSRLARAEKAALLAGLGLRLRRRRYDAALVFHRSFGSMRRLARMSGAPVTAGVSDGRDGYTHHSPAPAGPHSSREENRRVLESIGVEEDGGPLELWTSAEDELGAERLGLTAEHAPLIGLHPGSDWSCQQWLPDRFATVGRQLQDRLAATIVITGSASEMVLQEDVARGLGANTIQAAGATTLGELAAVIRHLDLLICVNSAPAAIAQAVGTPAVVLLGPEDPRLTALVAGPRLGIVQPGRRLAPGSWCEFGRWGILSSCESPMCRGISGLDRLDPQEVVGVAMRVMQSSGRLPQREAIAL